MTLHFFKMTSLAQSFKEVARAGGVKDGLNQANQIKNKLLTTDVHLK